MVGSRLGPNDNAIIHIRTRSKLEISGPLIAFFARASIGRITDRSGRRSVEASGRLCTASRLPGTASSLGSVRRVVQPARVLGSLSLATNELGPLILASGKRKQLDAD